MANSWFRLYAEFSTDPKVQMMSEVYQRRLVMLFCMKCNGDATLHDNEIAFQLRISSDEWAATKGEFIARGFLDSDNNLLNWDKRQFRSDSSTERSRKHREVKRSTTQQPCNVAATPPDTEQIQNRTEKKEANASSLAFEKFWDTYPTLNRSKGSKKQAQSAYEAAIKKTDHETILKGVNAYAAYLRNSGQSNADAFRWLRDERWGDDYAFAVGSPSGKPSTIDILQQGTALARAQREQRISG